MCLLAWDGLEQMQETSKEGLCSPWVTCVYLLINQTLDFWQLSNKMSLRNGAPVLKIR